MDSIENVLDVVKTAGEMAVEAQRKMIYSERGYKDDGSVVTETDRRVEDYLFERIADLYPGANIVTEETVRSFDAEKSHTFTVDPIDGTDVFSQGMPGWCVSVGLLSQELTPIAGIVFSPRLGLLLSADVGSQATLNGREIPVVKAQQPLSARSNITVTSTIHRQVDLSKFPGKIRSIGSAALHLCFPLIYPGVVGAVEGRRGRIWDIAASHAINLSHGLDLEYLGGGRVDYSAMIDGSPVGDVILAGTKERIDELRGVFTDIPTRGDRL